MIPKTALELLNTRSSLGSFSFGCSIIDARMGGIPFYGITEISGEAGSGKTQFCLSLAVRCRLQTLQGGLDGETAYLNCGEGEFPIRRLCQIATEFQGKFGVTSETFLQSIHIEQCHTVDDLQESLEKRLPKMCTDRRLKLIIIDSIAGVVRHEYKTSDKADMKCRTEYLFRLAQRLKWLADTFHLCIVVVNQVTSDISAHDQTLLSLHEDDDNENHSKNLLRENLPLSSPFRGDNRPALGLAWTHCVNSRIILSRDTSQIRRLGTASSSFHPLDDDHNNRNSLPNKQLHGYIDTADKENYGPNNTMAIPIKRSRFDFEKDQDNKDNTATPSVYTSRASERLMYFEFSPCRASSWCRYRIVNSGIAGIPEG